MDKKKSYRFIGGNGVINGRPRGKQIATASLNWKIDSRM